MVAGIEAVNKVHKTGPTYSCLPVIDTTASVSTSATLVLLFFSYCNKCYDQEQQRKKKEFILVYSS